MADAPAWLIEHLSERREKRGQAPALSEGEVITEGGRNSLLTSWAGTLRRRGADREEIYSFISMLNERRCDPPLDDSEVEKIADSVARYKPATYGSGLTRGPTFTRKPLPRRIVVEF
jgi:putative DNA primase/helicase